MITVYRKPVRVCSSLLMVLSVLLSFYIDTAVAFGNDKAEKRTKPVNTIVLHTIGGPECINGKVVFTGAPGDAKKWKAYFEASEAVGIHYVVDREGNIESSIDESRVAYHARGKNSTSIGIELVNVGDGKEEFPEEQIEALIKLVKAIKARHPDIVNANIIPHSDIDKRTFECNGADIKLKQDPGHRFPYERVLSAV
jgi:N-acetylmuramoyl-L-alanine amidase